MPLKPSSYFDTQACDYQSWQDQYGKKAVSFDEIIQVSQFNSTQLVLDLGCGPGARTLSAAPNIGRVIAMDISPSMLKMAAQFAAEAGATNISFVLGDANTLPFAPETFDLILSQSVLQFVDLERALPAVRSALRTGGQAAILHRAVKAHTPAARMQRILQSLWDVIKRSLAIFPEEGFAAGMRFVKTSLVRIYFARRYDAVRLDTAAAAGLYERYLPNCKIDIAPDGKVIFIHWSKTNLSQFHHQDGRNSL